MAAGSAPPAEGETGVQDRWPSWIFPKFTSISRGFFRDLRLAFSAPEEIEFIFRKAILIFARGTGRVGTVR